MGEHVEIFEHPIKPEFLVQEGPKLRLPENRTIIIEGFPMGTFPMDKEASGTFLSIAGGFIAPEHALSSVLSHDKHYAGAAFEGVRIYDSPLGTGFLNLTHNIARLLLSFTGIDASTSQILLEAASEDSITVPRRSDREMFRQVKLSMYNNKEPELWFTKSDGQIVSWPWRLSAVSPGGVKEYTVFELDAVIKALAFINGLVPIGVYPEGLVMSESGYFRPHLWIDSSGGLGVPTIYRDPITKELKIKPCAWSVSTLPWGKYLADEAYKKGIDAVIGPFERLGLDFFTDRKIAAHYINSLMNINVGVILGFGEIVALTRTGKAVEGSAENLFVIFKNDDGTYDCYTPPVGDGPLAGTTRLRMLRTLEKLQSQGIIKNIVYKSLPPEELPKAEAVFFTGTGAQIIHLRSICKIPELEQYVSAMRVRSEDDPNGESVTIPKLSEKSKVTQLINGGKKAEIMDILTNAYVTHVLDVNNKMFEPVYMIHDIDALATALGLDPKDIISRAEIKTAAAGYLRDVFDTRKGNGAKEIEERTRFVANILARALQTKARQHRICNIKLRRAQVRA